MSGDLVLGILLAIYFLLPSVTVTYMAWIGVEMMTSSREDKGFWYYYQIAMFTVAGLFPILLVLLSIFCFSQGNDKK